jgi:arabinofuranosyltransferase
MRSEKINTLKKLNIPFILILLLFSLYASAFIYRTSFIVNGIRYFSLFDDAMISMRYAMNFANGFGLVWNPGAERVEGFTNLLWVLFMSVFHHFAIDQSKISLFIQISGALFLLINLFFVKKIADLIFNESGAFSLGAVILTAFYLPINNWSLQGMEVGLLIPVMSIALYLAIQCLRNNKFSFGLYFLLGVSTLIRPDMVVPFLGFIIFLSVADPVNRFKNIARGLGILLFFVFAQTIFRFYYFNEILPNTYYLKLGGFPLFLRITRGLYVFFQFVYHLNWILFLLPFGILFFRHDKIILLLVSIFLLQVIYSIYVGGDAWEWWGGSNRYLCIVMPVFFILFSHSLNQLSKFITIKATEAVIMSPKGKKWFSDLTFPVLLIFSLLSFNSIYGSKALAEFLLIKPPLYTQQNKSMVEEALMLRKVTTPEAKIAVAWAGTIPYFLNRYSIDLSGKNDKNISHEKMRISSGVSRFIAFYPGHMKYNYKYSLGQLKPDVVVQLFFSADEAKPYLDSDYHEVILQNRFSVYFHNESACIMK